MLLEIESHEDVMLRSAGDICSTHMPSNIRHTTILSAITNWYPHIIQSLLHLMWYEEQSLQQKWFCYILQLQLWLLQLQVRCNNTCHTSIIYTGTTTTTAIALYKYNRYVTHDTVNVLYFFTFFSAKDVTVEESGATFISIYVGHLESKERLRIQPAQLFNFSWWVMWCVQ